MTKLANIRTLIGLLATDPVELFDRLEILWQARTERFLRKKAGSTVYPQTVSLDRGLRLVSRDLGHNLFEILTELELQKIKDRIARTTRELGKHPRLPFPTVFNADSSLVELCYALCRALQPETVLETGVAFGVTSATILAALAKNGKGELHSIDLPPIRARQSGSHIGIMVPREYEYRWHVYGGSSKRLLPSLLDGRLSEVNIALHDSANLYHVQKMEMETVWRHMSRCCAMIVNNIGNNPAFAQFIKQEKIDHWFVIRQIEKRGDLVGVILRN